MQVASRKTSLAALTAENDEYRKLRDEHTQLERGIVGLVRKKVVTADEEIELSRLKKLKLVTKGKMDKIEGDFLRQGG